MAAYVAVPLKKTYEVDLSKPLRQFIANTYSNAKPEDYEHAIQEFSRLRSQVMTKSADKHESALEVLFRYFDQLEAIESKFPITENNIRINFKWQDCFDKESFFSGKRNLTIATSGYEKVCILFNIGALESQIAECQNHSSDDGLKLAAKLFMQASGVFSHLKENVLSHVQGDPTPDLHPDTLGALSAVMLAQAQDCFCRKAMNDKMKPLSIAKLCGQAATYYTDAAKLLQLDTLKALWPKDWIPNIASKELAFQALAEYHQGLSSKEGKDFGTQIARLRKAKELILKSETRGGTTFVFQQHSKTIIRELEEAEKDNNFIYHAKIPEYNSMASIGKQPIAKPTPVPRPMSANFQDLFDKVVPLAVHQALINFEGRKAEIINLEIGRMREATQTLNGILTAFNLPAAIEDLSGTTVPQSVLEKAGTVRQMGGIQALNQLMSDLPELMKRNREILEQTMLALQEEGESDVQLRNQFKERWTRTPSDRLTAPIYEEGRKYQQIIDNALVADKIVQEKYQKNKKCMEVLSLSDADIAKALPCGSSVAQLKGTPVIEDLRKLMDDVEALKNERDVMEHEIKDSTFDMGSKFMMALGHDGSLDEASISLRALDQRYQPLREQVSENLRRQESLLAKVEQANQRFCQAKHDKGSTNTREDMLKDLQSAYDGFVELKGNLEEGTKFYNDLTNLLVKFQSKVNDFCFARKTEKEELMKDLTTAISRQSSAPPPPTPTYQQQGDNSNSRTPPARPPPPNIHTQNTAAQPPVVRPPAPSQPPPAYNSGNVPPYPTAPNYGASLPYPVYPQYAPMPQAYNPYGGAGPYGYMPPPPQGGPQPPYPQQQWGYQQPR